MREARQATTTEESTEGLYDRSGSNTRNTNKTIFGALRTRYPYEGADNCLFNGTLLESAGD